MSQLPSYTVDDLRPPDERLRVIFLLESPYLNEVLHKHPLAGKSGKTVARWLVDNVEEFYDWRREAPIGCQLKEWLVNYSRVGLMNCSPRPLDESVYDCSLDAADKQVVSSLNLIRIGTRANIQANPHAVMVDNCLVNDLRLRLVSLPDSTLIVPCGGIARRMVRACFFGTARVRLGRRPIIYNGRVPHPSRQSWLASDNQTDMNQLKDRLRIQLARVPEP